LHLLYRSNSYARFPYKLADKPILASVLLPNMYKYEAIQGERTIRILDLHPGRTTEVLACDLRLVDIDNAPPYSAISYVWGDPTSKSSMVCHGQPLGITSNLSDALQQLRNEHAHKYLWADAICINQSDEAERSQQVSLMGDIYKKASDVFVWLGLEDSRTEASFMGLEMTVSMMMTDPQLIENYGGYAASDLAAFDDLKPGERSITLEILNLFERPWFSRV
jgi:hypothetical protein